MVAPGQIEAKNPVYPTDADTKATEDSGAFESGAKMSVKPVGSSGTEVYGGYFAEEYLQQLRGRRGAKIWDEMRRSEPQVAMLLNAIMNPIKSGTWEITAAKDVADGEKHAELMRACLFDMIDFETFKHEALSVIPFGYSVFETIHNVVFNHPKFGTVNGLKALAFRGQKTLYAWNLEEQTGRLLSIEQYAYSDVGKTAVMPGEFLLVFSYQKEGDNYEGISALRPMFGPYFRKNLYHKLAAIGVERYAVGTVVGTIPSDASEDTAEIEKFKAILSSFTSHESSYVLKPEGWEVEIIKGDFDASEIKELITLENTEMINAVVANFLALGTNGSGGAFALATDLSDFFLNGIQSYANLICDVLNRQLIPNLIKLNFGPQDAYPRLSCTGISDKAGKEFAEVLKAMIDSGTIKADDKLETYVRKLLKLPEADPTTSREKPSSPAPFGNPNLSEKRRNGNVNVPIKLDAAYRKKFNASKEEVLGVMQVGLKAMLEATKADIKRQWNKATPANRPAIASKIEVKGVNAYRDSLKEVLAEVANGALISAKRDVPKAKNVKLAESIQLAAPPGGFFNALPSAVKKIVTTQANLIADTQAADLAKIVSFQFGSSATGTDSLDEVLSDIDEAALPTIEGSTKQGMSVDAAASNSVASIGNQTRLEFFFEPEVFDQIESFTFTNEDPVSAICEELNGTTWAANDPQIDKYSPPLHHNCKSRLVPNLKGDAGNPEIDRGDVPLTQKAIDSMTLCEPCYRLADPQSKCVADLIPELIAKGHSQEQAIAIAYSKCGEKAMAEYFAEIRSKYKLDA